MQNTLITLKKITKIFLGIPFTVISFYFILSIIAKNKENVIPYLGHLDLTTFSMGIFFFLLFFLLRGIGWREILKEHGYEIQRSKSIFLFAFSETKRYIPGNIFSFVARTKSFNTLSIPHKIIIKSLFIEACFLILSSAFISIPSFPLWSRFFNNTYLLQVAQTGVTILLFTVCIISVSALIFIKKQKLGTVRLNFREIISTKYVDIFFTYALGWLFFGLGSFLVATSFVPLDTNWFLALVCFFVASWLVGYLSFVAPMGLGVREAVIAIVLSSIIPLHLSTTLAILLRFMFILSELTFLLVIFGYYRLFIAKKMVRKLTSNMHELILFICIGAYTMYFTYVGFEKHLNFFTGRFDLGNMDQTVWNTLNGKLFVLTNPDGTNIISRLAVHADFILILLAPLYLLWQDPRMLILLQTVIIASGALFLYLLANYLLHNKNISLVFALSYLLNPMLQRQNLYDFHAITFTTTFLIMCIYFLLKSKYIPFLIFLFLSVLTKENVYIIAGMFGAYLFFWKKKKVGIFLLFFSILIFYLLVAKFIPEARGSNHFALAYYQDFGNSPLEIIRNIFLKPEKTVTYLFSTENAQYLLSLFFPVGYLSFLAPQFLIYPVSDFAINLLSSNTNLKSINFHYAATLLPFIYISAIYGAKKILQRKNVFSNQKVLSYFILFFSIFSTWIHGALPGSKSASIEVFTQKVAYRDQIKEFLKDIPEDLSVTATNNLGAHLSYREKIYIVPIAIDQADLVLFLLTDKLALPSLKEQEKMVHYVMQNDNYILLLRKDNFFAFVKKDELKRFQSQGIFLRRPFNNILVGKIEK